MTLTLYFLRHGQTECSRSNSYCGSIDPELTPDGMEMAQVFADAYASTYWKGSVEPLFFLDRTHQSTRLRNLPGT